MELVHNDFKKIIIHLYWYFADELAVLCHYCRCWCFL